MKYPHLSPPIIAGLTKLDDIKVRPLGKTELRCVRYFIRNPNTSISDCHKSVEPYVVDKKSKGFKKPNIRNIRKAAKNLVTKKLLEEGQKDHTAYYHITDYGVYYVLYQNESLFEELFPYLVYNYGNNIIFESLLSPYFDLSTIISTSIPIAIIRMYLVRCFRELRLYLENMKISTPIQVFTWKDLTLESTHPDFKTNFKQQNKFKLLTFLRNELHLLWVDDSAILKYSGKSTLEISNRDNRLVIRINSSQNKAFVFLNNQKIYTFDIYSFKVTEYGKEKEIRSTLVAPDMNASTFALSVLSNGLQINLELLIDEYISRGLLVLDRLILSTDKKFCELIKETRSSFESKLDTLKELESACKKVC